MRGWGSRRRTALAVSGLVLAVAVAAPGLGATKRSPGLPLGVGNLPETRTESVIAPGVTLTRIVRGTAPAASPSSKRGPWVVNLLTIDPAVGGGSLQVTHGLRLARTSLTTALTQSVGAVVGVNGSFFSIGSAKYPGDPVGLSVYRGQVQSEPTGQRSEFDLIVDSERNTVSIGPTRWTSSLRSLISGVELPLDVVNHPPVVPKGCAGLADQTACSGRGQVAMFTDRFGLPTPSGPGVEVTLNPLGCVSAVAQTRGTDVPDGHLTVQATGSAAQALLDVVRDGCVVQNTALSDGAGAPIALHPGVFAVAGRYRLTSGGKIVAPKGKSNLFGRHPRTIAGVAADGRILLATVDGRQASSVGANLAEAARIALSLGMVDSLILDGGGSTAMVARGELVNRPSGPERAVSDALVYVCPACG